MANQANDKNDEGTAPSAVNPGLNDSAADDLRGGQMGVQQGRKQTTGHGSSGAFGDGSVNAVDRGAGTRWDGFGSPGLLNVEGAIGDRRISSGYINSDSESPIQRGSEHDESGVFALDSPGSDPVPRGYIAGSKPIDEGGHVTTNDGVQDIGDGIARA